jgi:hypothetical protein
MPADGVQLIEHVRARHRERTVREVEDARAAIDEHEALPEQCVDGAGPESEQRELIDLSHRSPLTTP